MYDVYTWPKLLRNSFEFKHCLFGGTNIVEHSDEKKWLYSSYGLLMEQVHEILVMTLLG